VVFVKQLHQHFEKVNNRWLVVNLVVLPDWKRNEISMTPFKKLAAVFLTIFLSACSSYEKENYVEKSVGKIYNNAALALENRNWIEANRLFEEVERQHPYSKWATKAKLMTGYAQYQANNYANAIIIIDRFIQLHPGNKNIDYAYYLKALSYYEQISDISRDQINTTRALQALNEVIRRFPDSKFARDARLKRDLTIDHLAGKEMSVGRYYQKRGKYLAAIKRFKVVTEKYQMTTHTAESLHRLVECYLSIGMKNEALKAASVLGHNYPSSSWYSDSYSLLTPSVSNAKEKSQTRLERAWNWLF
jgi:outer membrane protein assembly factor BamD